MDHAGSNKHGFLEHALLLFQSKKTSDYHEEINGGVFWERFVNMMAGLEEGSVIGMDNASYHSIFIEKITTTTKKREVNIVHCLAQIRSEVGKKNKTFRIADIRLLLEQAVSHVTVEDWKKCVGHAERLHEEDFYNSELRDDNVTRM
ncbi:hypothetical protein J437_LFUL006375, partial [Ladona fulva]